MFTTSLKIPAKALLFGEYGLLYEGRALACVLPNLFFDVQIDVNALSLSHTVSSAASTARSDSTLVSITSDFFQNHEEIFILNDADNDELKNHFFHQALLPWGTYLKNYEIFIKINKSFSPSLGFGSSSALIAALSYALFVFVHKAEPQIDNEFLWEKIRASLKNVQGIASGYDVGIQLAYVLDMKNSFWIYQNKSNQVVPFITSIVLDKNLVSKLGCFVSTHVYSNTIEALTKFSALKEDEKHLFAEGHKKIVETFLNLPNFSILVECMHNSLILAQKQGIVANDELSEQLKKHQIPFKTMGSGCGDCLWVVENKENLLKKGLIQSSDIVFSFSDYAS